VGAGDRVVGRFLYRGTHTGQFFGIAPTGRRIEMRSIDAPLPPLPAAPPCSSWPCGRWDSVINAPPCKPLPSPPCALCSLFPESSVSRLVQEERLDLHVKVAWPVCGRSRTRRCVARRCRCSCSSGSCFHDTRAIRKSESPSHAEGGAYCRHTGRGTPLVAQPPVRCDERAGCRTGSGGHRSRAHRRRRCRTRSRRGTRSPRPSRPGRPRRSAGRYGRPRRPGEPGRRGARR
jgi:hypothetical protein